MPGILALMSPSDWIILIGAIAVFVIIAQRDFQRYKLQKAAIEKGLSVLPTGAPLWLASLKKGILVFTVGVGLIILGIVGYIDASAQIATIQNAPHPTPRTLPSAAPSATPTTTATSHASALAPDDVDAPSPLHSTFLLAQMRPLPPRPGGPGGLGSDGPHGPPFDPQDPNRPPPPRPEDNDLRGPGGSQGPQGPGPNLQGYGPNGPRLNGPNGLGNPGGPNGPRNLEFEAMHRAVDLRQISTYAIGAGGILALIGLVLTLFSLLERKYVLPISPKSDQ